jgi:drug/metabolite transporter (DMT)-like permease
MEITNFDIIIMHWYGFATTTYRLAGIPAAMVLLGEAAALVASILWTFTSLCFTYSSKRIGPLAVNLLRLILAVGMLGLTHLVILGSLIPAANDAQWGYLGLSGIIGLALGDLGYFGSLVILRPRRATLLMGLARLNTKRQKTTSRSRGTSQ